MDEFKVFCCKCGNDISNRKSPLGGYLCFDCGQPIAETEVIIKDSNQRQTKPQKIKQNE